jgi:very-short-patch-repair endonuclease
LIIEVDGGQHAEEAEKDDARTKRLEAHGFKVIRFWNHDVLRNLEGVLAIIAEALRAPGFEESDDPDTEGAHEESQS